MKIAITGSRYLTNEYINKVLIEGTNKFIGRSLRSILEGMYFEFFDNDIPPIFIEGGAPGADTLAKEWCKNHNILYEEYPANWKEYGKSAGPIRNQRMAEKCDYCLAFPIIGLENKGTMDMIKKCEELNKTVDIYWMEK